MRRQHRHGDRIMVLNHIHDLIVTGEDVQFISECKAAFNVRHDGLGDFALRRLTIFLDPNRFIQKNQRLWHVVQKRGHASPSFIIEERHKLIPSRKMAQLFQPLTHFIHSLFEAVAGFRHARPA